MSLMRLYRIACRAAVFASVHPYHHPISRKDIIPTPSQPINNWNILLAEVKMSMVIRNNVRYLMNRLMCGPVPDVLSQMYCLCSLHTHLHRLVFDRPGTQDGSLTCSGSQSPPRWPPLLWQGRCPDVWSPKQDLSQKLYRFCSMHSHLSRLVSEGPGAQDLVFSLVSISRSGTIKWKLKMTSIQPCFDLLIFWFHMI